MNKIQINNSVLKNKENSFLKLIKYCFLQTNFPIVSKLFQNYETTLFK